MNNKKLNSRTSLRSFIVLTVILISITACKKNKTTDNIVQQSDDKSEVLKDDQQEEEANWWLPIFEENNISADNYNADNDMFVSGKSMITTDGIICFEEALFIIRRMNGEHSILTAPTAYYDIEEKMISGSVAVIKRISNNKLLSSEAVEVTDFIVQLPSDGSVPREYKLTSKRMKPYFDSKE